MVATDGAPTGPAVPSFACRLPDAEIAAVVIYTRNAWGNAASPVSIGDVTTLPQALHRQAQAP